MNTQKIREKWQLNWEQNKPFAAINNSKKPKYYILDMFPYPSGNGLHVGHAVGYIGSDVIARKKRMEGFNVLHPMGWDAFGLPAEQYAIKTGIHPAITTEKNCTTFRNQLKYMGLSYDWDREINTSQPEYFKWTQLLFLKMYDAGLVYEKEENVWWCEELKTVLANEEVINGRSERGDYPCIRRPLKQWVMKITAYAEKLLQDLEELDWPESIKMMQKEWIGKSEGSDIVFDVEGSDKTITVFSSRPETIFGVNAIVISTEHPLIEKIASEDIKAVLAEKLSAIHSTKADIKTFDLGAKAIHPFTGEVVPVFVANYVLSSYGHGAVMSVPAHDVRDQKFSEIAGLSYIPVLDEDNDNRLINSGFLNGLSVSDARTKIIDSLESIEKGTRIVRYRMHDWLFSRQRYWGEPFPLYRNANGEIETASVDELPILLPEVDDYAPSVDGKSPLQNVHHWVNQQDANGNPRYRVTDTMPGWAGSCWYYLRFMDPHNSEAPFDPEVEKYWGQVDLYIGGAAHATMHLLYARFWHKVFFDLGIVSNKEPFKQLFNQGLITAHAFKDETGRIVAVDEAEHSGDGYVIKGTNKPLYIYNTKMSKSLLNVVTPESVIDEYGVDAFRLYMMFLGSLEQDKKWETKAISGCERFVKRTWKLFVDDDGNIRKNLLSEAKAGNSIVNKAWNAAFKRIDDSFAGFNFNTAVAAFMEFMNVADKHAEQFDKAIAHQFLSALSPFAPHICSELWDMAGYGDISAIKWPKVFKEDQKQLKVMVNGKFVAVLEDVAECQEDNITKAKKLVDKRISDDSIRRIIYKENQIVNFIV